MTKNLNRFVGKRVDVLCNYQGNLCNVRSGTVETIVGTHDSLVINFTDCRVEEIKENVRKIEYMIGLIKVTFEDGSTDCLDFYT
jgi:hypothetical protein